MVSILARDTDSTARAPVAISGRDASGNLQTIAWGKVRDATGLLKTIFASFGSSATASPDSVFGYAYSHASIQVTTDSTTVTVAGGALPIAYVWTFDDGGWSAVSPGSNTTSFRSPTIAPGASANVTATCTATDANGAVATVDVAVGAYNNGS